MRSRESEVKDQSVTDSKIEEIIVEDKDPNVFIFLLYFYKQI